MTKSIFLSLFALFVCVGLVSAQQKSQTKKKYRHRKTATVEYGIASFYHNKFNGRHTANGEVFDQKKLTAAHNSLPLGTWIEVTNLKNNKSVVVKVNDRMHKNNPRLVDLSHAAAKELGIRGDSLLRVKVTVLNKKKRRKKAKHT